MLPLQHIHEIIMLQDNSYVIKEDISYAIKCSRIII